MWIRAELKDRAKSVLRTNYWMAFLISLVIVFVSGSGGSYTWRSGRSSFPQYSYSDIDSGLIAIILVILAAAAFAIIIAIAVRILVFYSLEVGGRRYFIQSAQHFDNRGCFRFGFDGRNYTGIISTMFLKDLFNFLWALLIIPGIIKFYSYRMAPYILADNPNIGAIRAITLSRNMMRGNKWRMFVLDLSFLGWYLLGTLCLGIGVLFVNPYAFATEAELYLVLRGNAIQSGMCSLDELNLYDPAQTGYNA